MIPAADVYVVPLTFGQIRVAVELEAVEADIVVDFDMEIENAEDDVEVELTTAEVEDGMISVVGKAPP